MGGWILGLSGSHNGAACLVRDGRVAVAIQEERLTREKRAWLLAGRPSRAVAYCLEAAGIGPRDLDLVVHSTTRSLAAPECDPRVNPQLAPAGPDLRVVALGHHLAHAWSAFAASGFDEAAVLVVDGAGSPLVDLAPAERAVRVGGSGGDDGRETISLYRAGPAGLEPLEKHAFAGAAWLLEPLGPGGMRRFRSLGGMFSAVAELLFGSKWEAGKVMGLAPYGRARFAPEDFFRIEDGAFVYADALPARFAGPAPWVEGSAEAADLAASVQGALERALGYLAGRALALAGCRRLCYAGGVALNGVANEKVLFGPELRGVESYVPAAAEDSGAGLGAGWYGAWREGAGRGSRLSHDAMGRSYSRGETLAAVAAEPRVRILTDREGIGFAADALAAGKVVGWFQGGAELGPRALGQRSILFDPRRPDGKELLNARVKHREAFRPFAPAVLLEEAAHWFEPGPEPESPFMLRVRPFRPEVRERVPAVVHVDGTGRVQTLTAAANGAFYALVREFFVRTGVPMVLNTSFNVQGMPIVESPADAIRCMLSTGVDICCIDGLPIGRVP